MEILVKLAQFLLCLSLLVLVHELGHYLCSRLCRARVEKFYLFFNPGFSLVRVKRFNGRWHFSWLSKSAPEAWISCSEKTEWGIGWLPFGGYCKIAGMVDESFDRAQLRKAPRTWEFRSRPAGQRLLIMAGGVLFNVLFAMLIYSGILYAWGEAYFDNRDLRYGVESGTLGQTLGIQNGDKLIALDGEPVERFSSLTLDIVRNKVERLTVERNGQLVELALDPEVRRQLRRAPYGALALVRQPAIISTVVDSSVAIAAGLQAGDTLMAIGGQPTAFADEVRAILVTCAGERTLLSLRRAGERFSLAVDVPQSGRIGVTMGQIGPRVIRYGLLQALPRGVEKCVDEVVNYCKDIRLIFSPKEKAYAEVGGIGAIVSAFPSMWSWYDFWNLCALLSIMLAVVNLLPIPALDGGHILFLLYELVSRRKFSDKFKEQATAVGLLVVAALVILANGNDIIRWLD